MFIFAGLIAILMIGCMLTYCLGMFSFHFAVAKAVAHFLGQGKKFATLPVVGGVVAALFCLLGLSWSVVSAIHLTPITVMVMVPGLLVGFSLIAPVIACVTLIRSKSESLQKVREAGSICTMAAVAFFVLAWVRGTFLPNW